MTNPRQTVSSVIEFVQVSVRGVLERMVIELCTLSIVEEFFSPKIPVRKEDAERK